MNSGDDGGLGVDQRLITPQYWESRGLIRVSSNTCYWTLPYSIFRIEKEETSVVY